MKEIAFVRLKHSAIAQPTSATVGSAGIDLCVKIARSYYLFPGHTALFPTDMFIEIPSGYEGQIRPRSGWAAQGRTIIPNSPGTIDSDYRGEIKIILSNVGDAIQIIYPNDRIAQLVIAPLANTKIQYTRALTDTARGERGLGSTGL